jgi:hypothetical protein
MDNKGLLFIPDISGFTRFVSEMEIEHSRNIIQGLLEILIDSNQLGLEVSEVEGDAILFYKFGTLPTLDEIYKQVEKMFCSFHRHLLAYEHRRFCQCEACLSAIKLSLKVVTHYGEFTGYNVKNFYKLIGKDVIVAHQLLKNDIDQHEYWLVTKNIAPSVPTADLTNWMHWDSSVKQTETGEIPFYYTQLSALKKDLSPAPLSLVEMDNKVKVLSVSKEYNADSKTMFYTSAHFEFRQNWMEGIKHIEQLDHLLPAVGMRLRVVTDQGEKIVYSSSFIYDPENKIIFSETDENKKSAYYFILEKIAPKKTKLTIDFYLRKNLAERIIFRLTKKKVMEAKLQRSLLNLEEFVKNIQLPVQF